MTHPVAGSRSGATGSWHRTARWHDVVRAAGLTDTSGEVRPTVFAEMTGLAVRTGAINLGQGFPDVDGPEHVARAAMAAIEAGHNQYAPGGGIPALRRAVVVHQERHYGLSPDPDSQVLVTTGATEAIAATVLALAGPGDQVLTIEPYYDSYAAVIAMAGAEHVTVGLIPGPAGDLRLDLVGLAAAFTERTRLVLVNSPHNPTGTVLTRPELTAVARLARQWDAVVVTDEVYEHLTYDGVEHVPMATLPGMAERTLSISSAGKSLSFTGWKIGWLTGPTELVSAVRAVQQFLTYTSGAPFQPAIAAALTDEDGRTGAYVRDLVTSLTVRRDLLCQGLTAAGFEVVVPQGTYFVVADGARLGFADGVELCRRLPGLAGVVGVPVSAFCRAGSATAEAMRPRVRFTFVKRTEVLTEAVSRLARLGGRGSTVDPDPEEGPPT